MKKLWEEKTLGEVCEIKTGKKDVNQGNPNGEYPFFTCAREHTHSDEFSFDTEALLIAGNGDVGTVSYCKGKFEAYQRTYVLFNFIDISPRFLFFILDGYLKQAVSKQKLGNTMPYIKMGMLADFKIPLPPILEQKRIVKILDEVFEKVTKAKENAEKNLQNAHELFESYLQSIFANPGNGWGKKKLGDICLLITDGKHGDCKNEENSGYYFLSAKDVKNNTLHYENARQITKADFEETHRRTDLKPGDVLVTNSGTIGRMAIAPHDKKTLRTTFQKSVAIIKPMDSILESVFCCYRLKADLTKLVNVSAGTAQKNLLLGDLRKHIVSFPPLKKQRAITVKLDSLYSETQKLETIYQQKLAGLKELKKSVLQKAFRGEL